MRYVFLVLLIVVSSIHLYHSWKDDKPNRNKTKGLILPMIIFYYLCSTSDPEWILVGALTASWIGDVLLIPKGHKWFAWGGLAFAVSHCLFVYTYLLQIEFPVVKWYTVIPIALIYYVISAIIIIKLTPTTPKIMIAPMYLYLLTNSTMNLFSLMQLESDPCLGSVIAYIGAVLFFISDCSLFLVRYYRNPDIVFKRHFTVMGTYILGELLIAQGILMLSI